MHPSPDKRIAGARVLLVPTSDDSRQPRGMGSPKCSLPFGYRDQDIGKRMSLMLARRRNARIVRQPFHPGGQRD